jgi:hypothetical protein
MKTQCQECGSVDLQWHCSIVNNSDVQQGRLRSHDMGVLFFLGCNECSATVQRSSGDQIARRLNRDSTEVEADAEAVNDAARWRTVLSFVGGHYSPATGHGFSVTHLKAVAGADITDGRVEYHFTNAIDACIAAQATAKGAA